MTRFPIANKATSGVIWSVGGSAGQALFQLAIFIALARILSPEIFGIVAIASALIDVLNLIGRGGLVEVLVHRADVSARQYNTGFFASLSIGIILTAMLLLAAPYLASLFQIEQLDDVVSLLAPVCLLYAIGAVYEAKLRRDFQFKQLAMRNASATVVSGLIALAMAFGGFGVYALVAQRLVSTVWALVSMAIASRWLPKTDVDLHDMRAQLKHGSAIAVSSVLGAGNQRLIDLIVGYFLGATQLGYLRIAWRVLDLLMEIVVRPVGSVALSTLSKTRAAGGDVGGEYIKLIRWSSIFIVPAFIGFSAVSEEIIAIMFGGKWAVSAELLSIASLIGLFVPLIYFKSNVLVAAGKFRHVLFLNAIEFLVSVVIVSLFSPFGLISATWGNVLRTAISTPIILLYMQRLLQISVWQSVKASLPAALSSLVMLAIIFALKHWLPQFGNAYLNVGLYIVIGGISYVLLILLTDRHLIADLKAMRQAR